MRAVASICCEKCCKKCTWKEEGAEIRASRAHEPGEDAEGGLLRQIHEDDACHKGHALTI